MVLSTLYHLLQTAALPPLSSWHCALSLLMDIDHRKTERSCSHMDTVGCSFFFLQLKAKLVQHWCILMDVNFTITYGNIKRFSITPSINFWLSLSGLRGGWRLSQLPQSERCGLLWVKIKFLLTSKTGKKQNYCNGYNFRHTLTDYFISCILLILGWTPFFLQNHLNSLSQRFNKPLVHVESITQLLQIHLWISCHSEGGLLDLDVVIVEAFLVQGTKFEMI